MNESLAARSVGLDIGGANLKVFRASTGPEGAVRQCMGLTRTAAFAVWKQPERLGEVLADLLGDMPAYDVLAVTMTAELCDCFESKRAGVEAVLDAVEEAAAGRRVWVWQTNGRFVEPDEARETWLQTAAANWLALATYAGRFAQQGRGLLIDVGSTTTDIIPLLEGVPVPQGRSDPERLASGELVYSGVRRTPVCALVREVPWRGKPCGVAAEWFATTRDVYLLLGDLEENQDDRETADGRPATRCRAHDRLARVVCADGAMLAREETGAIAEAVAEAQMRQWRGALDQVAQGLGGMPDTVVLSGEGEFLARRFVEGAWREAEKPKIVSLAEQLGDAASQAACAHAVAVLAQEHLVGQSTPGVSLRKPVLPHEEEAAPGKPLVVIKVGGSLLDLDDLPERLHRLLNRRSGQRSLLVVGGGRAADAVRELDKRHRFGNDTAHWLGVRAMAFNARLLEATMAEASVVVDPRQAERCSEEGVLPILDPWEMLRRVERDFAGGTTGLGFVLPHAWEVTSDSIAAWVALRMGAQELILAKSVDLEGRPTVGEAVRRGVVDGYFERACAELPVVTYVNLRARALSEVALWH